MSETENQQKCEELIQKILDSAQDALSGGDKYWSGEFAIPVYREGFIDIIGMCQDYLKA